jgi:signal transduction histidine kinase
LEHIAEENRRSNREVERLNRQLETRVDETLAAVRARDEFLSIASHELRTPLTALSLQAQLAERQMMEGGAVSDRLKAINRHTDRLEVLVNRLLDLSRVTAHRFEIDRAEVDLSTIAREVVARLQPGAQQVRSKLTLVVETDRSMIGEWDALRLEQLLVNLVSNAAKFGAGKPIQLNLTEAGDTVHLTVMDHGIGISAEHQKRIFLPFERACSSRNYGGLGLGLWISAEIVKAHHGTIAVVSQENQGALFTVVLPKKPNRMLATTSLVVDDAPLAAST